MKTVYNVHTSFGADYWVVATSLEHAIKKVLKAKILDVREKPSGVSMAGTIDVE